jgi:hypothetical protein
VIALAPDRHLEYALKYLGLIALEAPATVPIVYETAHCIASAMAEMRRISSWAPVPTEMFFRELPPAEVVRLMTGRGQ